MVVLRAIGGFFARIGRWIKETAWIQPLLIVGAIFAVIFSIPHIIKGVSSWFDESDSANKFLTRYRLDLKDANVVPDGKYVGKSKVDEFLTYVEDGETEKIKTTYGERFFVAFVKDDSSSKDLYGGLKTFKDKWAAKDQEFVGIDKNLLNIVVAPTEKNKPSMLTPQLLLMAKKSTYSMKFGQTTTHCLKQWRQVIT